MKNVLFRATVLSLTVFGFASSTIANKVAKAPVAPKPVVVSGVGSAPLCMPHDPTYCGLM